MEPFRFHLFVCTQPKPEGVTSCPSRGSLAVLEKLDRELQSRGQCSQIQLTTCGCMGLCDEGPIMVVYPEGIWYRRVRPADVPELVDAHLCGKKPVARLVWNDPAAMKATSVEHAEKFRAAMAERDKAGTLPDPLDQMIRGFQPSRCVLTALELDLFSAVADGSSAEEIGSRVNANARAVSMLLNALVSLGLLMKDGRRYSNTPASARFFVQGSKDNQRDGLLHTANIWHRWSTLTEAVHKGTRIAIDREQSDWTRNFISGMQRNAKHRAPLVMKKLGIDGVHRILDLGGGSGAYSIAFAKATPGVHCDILDLPEVVPLTSQYVKDAGVSAQISLRAGDMLQDELGSNYDLILLNAICHMFSEEQNEELFRRARKALAPNGRLAVQDFVLNNEKTGPQHAALFSLNMLVGTERGASYSEAEYALWMKTAGFCDVTRIDLPGPSDLIVGRVE
jgi:3-hydroxy-5-methyl-1-naphthoate 3-O-methyltransferase